MYTVLLFCIFQVLFCCDSCLEEANGHYHRAECQYLKHLLVKNTVKPETLLAMRVVMRLTNQGSSTKLNNLMNHKRYQNPFALKTFTSLASDPIHSDSDTTLAKLCDNLGNMNAKLNSEMFETTISLLHLLKKTTNFFLQEEQDVEGEHEVRQPPTAPHPDAQLPDAQLPDAQLPANGRDQQEERRPLIENIDGEPSVNNQVSSHDYSALIVCFSTRPKTAGCS